MRWLTAVLVLIVVALLWSFGLVQLAAAVLLFGGFVLALARQIRSPSRCCSSAKTTSCGPGRKQNTDTGVQHESRN